MATREYLMTSPSLQDSLVASRSSWVDMTGMPDLPYFFLSVLSIKLSIMISFLALQILTHASPTCQGWRNCLPSWPILPQPHHAHLLDLHALLSPVSRL